MLATFGCGPGCGTLREGACWTKDRLVRPGEFSDAALILFGHGTSLVSDSATAVLQHVAELRRRDVFGEVREAFWKQEPRLSDVALQVGRSRVFFVPFFFSAGYFSEQVIPTELGFDCREARVVNRILVHGGHTWFYCHPVGTHRRITNVVLERANAVLSGFPFPRVPAIRDTSLIIAGHGTRQNQQSRLAVETQAEIIRSLGVYAGVHSVFLEEEPRLDSCYQLASTRNVVVVPFFAGDGPHVQKDIPMLLGETGRIVRSRLKQGRPTWSNPTERQGKLVWLAPSVGTASTMAEVVLACVREAAELGR